MYVEQHGVKAGGTVHPSPYTAAGRGRERVWEWRKGGGGNKRGVSCWRQTASKCYLDQIRQDEGFEEALFEQPPVLATIAHLLAPALHCK